LLFLVVTECDALFIIILNMNEGYAVKNDMQTNDRTEQIFLKSYN